MLPSSLHLFEQITPNMFHLVQELDKPKLRNIFNINKTQVQLTLTDNFIVLSDHLNFRSPTHFCKLNFDLKFEVIYQPSQVSLFIFSKKITLESQLPSNQNEKPAKNSLSSMLPFQPLSTSGPLNFKNVSISAIFTNFSKPRRKSAKVLSQLSIQPKGCETIRWLRSKPFQRRSNMLEIRVDNPLKTK